MTVVFFKLGTSPSIIAFFIAVIIRDLRGIFFKVFRPCVTRNCIIPGSIGNKAEVLLFGFLFLKAFFGLFPNLLGGFRITKGIICRLKVFGLWLRFFNSRVFYNSVLSLYLGHGDVSEIIAILSSVVYFPNIRSRLEACFGFNLNRLLDYFFLSVQFLTFLFYLSLYEGLKVFIEGLRPSWKNLIKSDSSRAPLISNFNRID